MTPAVFHFAETMSQRHLGNRRITIRYRCAPATAGKVLTSEDHEFQRAWIDNLSRSGAGLFLSKPVAAGSVVAIQLKAAANFDTYELAGTVAHVTLREPYGWYVGIEFQNPIAEDLLEAVL